MTDQKHTGVFVRLPLSREDEQKIHDLEPYKGGKERALLSIGTPVTGGELEVVCSIDEDILRDISELDDDDEEYVTDMVFKPNPEGVDTAPLVRQSDALAKLAERYNAGWVAGKRDAHLSYTRQIAAKDAEIARLQKALDAAYELERMRSGKAKVALQEAAQKALKGPEA